MGRLLEVHYSYVLLEGSMTVDNDHILYIWKLEDAWWDSLAEKGVSLSSPDSWVLQNPQSRKKELTPAHCSHVCAIMPESVCTHLSVCHVCSLPAEVKRVLDPLKLYMSLEMGAGNFTWILWKSGMLS